MKHHTGAVIESVLLREDNLNIDEPTSQGHASTNEGQLQIHRGGASSPPRYDMNREGQVGLAQSRTFFPVSKFLAGAWAQANESFGVLVHKDKKVRSV